MYVVHGFLALPVLFHVVSAMLNVIYWLSCVVSSIAFFWPSSAVASALVLIQTGASMYKWNLIDNNGVKVT
jgi:hypothetical protein